jgi:hypothetical protein
VVASEVAQVVGVPIVGIARYESDETATQCASIRPEGPLLPLGRRWSLEGVSVLKLVRERAEAARIDDYSLLEGEIAGDSPAHCSWIRRESDRGRGLALGRDRAP